eukprot:2612312-Pleurochrysis_carterae.AAC.1
MVATPRQTWLKSVQDERHASASAAAFAAATRLRSKSDAWLHETLKAATGRAATPAEMPSAAYATAAAVTKLMRRRERAWRRVWLPSFAIAQTAIAYQRRELEDASSILKHLCGAKDEQRAKSARSTLRVMVHIQRDNAPIWPINSSLMPVCSNFFGVSIVT